MLFQNVGKQVLLLAQGLTQLSKNSNFITFLLNLQNTNEWKLLSSQQASHGKVNYILPTEDKLQRGLYQIRMLVRLVGKLFFCKCYIFLVYKI